MAGFEFKSLTADWPEIDKAGIQQREQTDRGGLGCTTCPVRKGMWQPSLMQSSSKEEGRSVVCRRKKVSVGEKMKVEEQEEAPAAMQSPGIISGTF